MAGIPTLHFIHTTLDQLRDHLLFLMVRVQAEPLAAAFVPAAQALLPQWDTVDVQHRKLSDAVLLAKAHAIVKDNALNRVADQVSAVIHGGSTVDVSDPTHHIYFAKETTSDFKKPLLGKQLKAMQTWPGLLAEADQAGLKALAPAAASAVSDGEAAEKALAKAGAELDKFELDGPVKDLFDAYNAMAATTFGGLKAIAHAQKAPKLPASWAQTFFLHDTRRAKALGSAEAEKAVNKLKAELAAAEQALADAKAAEQAVKEAELAAQKAKTEAEEADKTASAARQKEKSANLALEKAKKAKP